MGRPYRILEHLSAALILIRHPQMHQRYAIVFAGERDGTFVTRARS